MTTPTEFIEAKYGPDDLRMFSYSEVIDNITEYATIRRMYKKNSLLTPDSIIETICNAYRITDEEIKMNTRKTEIVEARQIAMTFILHVCIMPLAKIGYIFTKDHATVLYAKKMVKNHYKSEPVYRSKIVALMDMLNFSDIEKFDFTEFLEEDKFKF